MRSSKGKLSRSPLAAALLAAIFFCCPALLHAAPTLVGDLNEDGIIDVRDLVILQGYANGTRTLPAAIIPFADLNRDGAVNQTDAGEIKKLIVGTRELESLPLSTVRTTSPYVGETDVAVMRETIVHFTVPLSLGATLDTTQFYAQFGGQKILSRVEISSDRKKATLFYLQPLPSNARLQVTLDGSALTDLLGRPFDADGDTQAGGTFTGFFDTLSITGLANTGVVGRVVASEKGPGGTDVPLAGVTVTVDGAEQDLRAVTDADGRFTLSPCPAGSFFVHVDGRTSPLSAFPNGAYYPFVGKKWFAAAGRLDNKSGDVNDSPTGGTGIVFLPFVPAGALKPTSNTQDTTVTLAAGGLAAGTSIKVPAGSLFSDEGMREGNVGLAAVPRDRLPGPLPQGVNPPFVVTVQTNGPSNFDVPVPISFPNVEGLTPGTRRFLLSFNHDLGEWEPIGPMTVTQDGLFVTTDTGVGLAQPGWHAPGPPPENPPPPKPEPPDPCKPTKEQVWHCTYGALVYYTACTVKNVRKSIWAFYKIHQCKKKAIRLGKVCKLTYRLVNCPPFRSRLFNAAQAADPLAEVEALEGDPTFVVVMAKGDEILNLLYPYSIANLPTPAAVQSQVDRLHAEADVLAGGDAIGYVEAILLRMEKLLEEEPTTLEVPPYPVHYVATLETPNGFVKLRGMTRAQAQYAIFPPENGKLVDVILYDPISNQVAQVVPNLNPAAPYRLPTAAFMSLAFGTVETDQDGLVDVLEDVYGTDPTDPDTDNDGVNDLIETQQGTDPLGGYIAQTGVIAAAPSSAAAHDVAVTNGVAITANNSRRASLFNVNAGFNPTQIADIVFPDTVNSVAVSPTLAAVACGNSGLGLVDVTLPIGFTPRLVGVGGDARVVSLAGGIAFVGLNSGELVAVDTVSATLLTRHSASALGIDDIAVRGNAVYALRKGSLSVYRWTGALLEHQSNITIRGFNSFRWRLFAAENLLYASHSRGYNLVDITNPLAPTLIRNQQETQFGWKQIVANGSGLGVAAVGNNGSLDGPHDINLYDLGADGRSTNFLTKFPIDGIARAVSIYNGLAYVAVERRNGTGALEVLSYRPYDALGVPPTIALSTSIPGTSVDEGSALSASARVTDDVQVRNVEFYVDGALAFTDGNYPFDYQFDAPTLAPQKTTFKLRAKATDTGGNASWSDELTYTLTPDSTGPLVTFSLPRHNRLAVGVQTVSVFFNESIQALDTLPTYALLDLGADSVPGGDDDSPVDFSAVQVVDSKRLLLSLPSELPTGNYQLTIPAAAVTDLAGNAMNTDAVIAFAARATPAANTAYWNTSGGDWFTPDNWSTGFVPGANERVIVDYGTVAFTGTRTLPSENVTIATTLSLSDASLTLNGKWNVTGTLEVRGKNSITANGAKAGFTYGGTGALTATDLVALNGAVIDLPAVTSYVGKSRTTGKIIADGNGSKVLIPAVTGVSSGSGISAALSIQAKNGGTVNLNAVAGLTTAPGGLPGESHPVNVLADGVGSNVQFGMLSSFVDSSNKRISSIEVMNGGFIQAPALTSLSGVTITISQVGGLPTSQISSLRFGGLVVDGIAANLAGATDITGSTVQLLNGGTVDLSKASSINGASFVVKDGVTLQLPSVTTYTGATRAESQFFVTGAGSVLDLSKLTEAASGDDLFATLRIKSLSGGVIDLSGITSLTTAPGGLPGESHPVIVLAEGAGSLVKLDAVTSFVDSSNTRLSSMETKTGGMIQASQLTTLDGVSLNIAQVGGQPTAQITSLKNGRINVTGVAASFGGLTDIRGTKVELLGGGTVNLNNASAINGASFIVRAGVTLQLPAATTYTGPTGRAGQMIADGVGSLLDLSSLTAVGSGDDLGASLQIQALAGGLVDLKEVSVLTTISGGLPGETHPVAVLADGIGSLVKLDALTSFVDSSNTRSSSMETKNSGLIQATQLATLDGVSLNIRESGGQSLSQITSLKNGQINVTGVAASFGSLTDIRGTKVELLGGGTVNLNNASAINGASFIVRAGVTLQLPAATSYVGPTRRAGRMIADGAGSLLDLSGLTAVGSGSDLGASLQIQALAGGVVDLKAATALTTVSGGLPGETHPVALLADGPGSLVKLDVLTSFVDSSNKKASSMEIKNSGIIQVPLLLQSGISGVTITGFTLPP